MKIVAFTGPSNSGKTTLIVKIIEILQSTYTLTVIKNDPSNKAVFDTPGKDSYKFYNSGADVLVLSPEKIAYFSKKKRDFNELIKMCNSDFVFVEGLKYLDLPRIGVFRDNFDDKYLPYMQCAAISNIEKNIFPEDIATFDLNKTDDIIAWIFKNAKEI